MKRIRGILTLVLLLCLPGVALATHETTLRYGGAGQGIVVFDGRLHAGKGYVCNDCHLDFFTTQKKARITIREHFSKASCFTCHDNKTASRDCATCHRKFASEPMSSTGAMALMQVHPLASDADTKPLLEGKFGASEQSRACLSCHGKGGLAPVSDRGRTLRINLDVKALVAGTHGTLACATCHMGGAGKDSFTQLPHKIDREASPGCLSCHKESMALRIASFQQSAHYARVQEKVACADCHDAHAMPKKGAKKASYPQAATRLNADCLACHADNSRLKSLSGKDMRPVATAHAFLDSWDTHAKTVMCVECHTASDRGHDGTGKEHVILKKEDSLRDCAACHTDSGSLIVKRAAAYADGSTAFSKGYMPGLPKAGGFDAFARYALVLLLALIAAHVAGRLMGAKAAAGAEASARRVFVYPAFVRASHWLNALLFIVLLVTGLSVHFTGASREIGLGTAVRVHDAAGVLLIVNFALFLIAGIATGDIRQYLPRCEGLAGGLAAQARYYLYGIFKGEPHPFAVTREARFNPLQQVTYLLVFILGMPLLILSGLVLLVPGLAGGIDRACLAWIHYALAVFYGLFLVGHAYLATTGKKPGSLIKGMIDGYHESDDAAEQAEKKPE